MMKLKNIQLVHCCYDKERGTHGFSATNKTEQRKNQTKPDQTPHIPKMTCYCVP